MLAGLHAGLTGSLPDDPMGSCGRRPHRVVERLVGARTPVLQADPPDAPIDASTRLRLTTAGHLVLRGEADHVAQSGIDRWIGGVHLAGDDARWRWDEGTESIV